MKSKLMQQLREESVETCKAMTPQERLVAFSNHSQLISRLYEAGKKFRASRK